MEKSLLRKGYSADALMTDFEEVPADLRGKPGTVQLNFVASSQARAQKLKEQLQPQFPILGNADVRSAHLKRADIDIRLF